MKKCFVKIISLLLVLIIVLTTVIANIQISSATSDEEYRYTKDGMTGFVYTINNGEIRIESRWLKDEFVVPESIDGLPVTSINCSGDSHWNGTSVERYIDTVIYIPVSVKEVVGNGTKKFVVDEANPYLSSDEHGVLFDKNKETLISYPIANMAKEYIVPDSVKYIAENAFRGAICLENLVLNEGLLEIGLYSVAETISLKTVNIPSTVTSVHNSSFTQGLALESITVDENNQYYSSDEYGVLFDKAKTKLMQYPAAAPAESYVIPEGVTDFILDWYGPTLYPFAGVHYLKEITIPASVTSEMHFASYMSFFERINVSPNHLEYKSVDGVVYNKDGSELVNYPGGSKETCLVVPNGVTSFGYRFNHPTHKYLASIVYNNEMSENTTPIEDGEEYSNSSSPMLTDVYFMGDGEAYERTAVNTYYDKAVTYHYNCKPDDHFHDYEFEITKSPDCSHSGEALLTCSCGKTLTAKVDAVGTHNYVSELVGFSYEACCATLYEYNGLVCETCEIGGYIYFSSKENPDEFDISTTFSPSEDGGRIGTSVCNFCEETVDTVYIKDGYKAIVFKNNGWDFVAKIKPGDPINVNYVPETEGKTFLGWEDGNGDVVDVPETMPDEDLYLRAVWADAPEPEPDTNGVFVAGTLVSGDETGYWLTVDGGLTAENASAENHNVKYIPATDLTNAKLVLNNAVLNKGTQIEGENTVFVIYSTEELDIELLGENTITDSDCAFALLPNSEFIGNGKLNADDLQYFIISGSNVTISGNVSVDADAFYGIVAEGGTVTIEGNANVNITGAGIYTTGLTVKDDAVLTIETAVSDKKLPSVELWGDINISGNAVVNLSNIKESVDETEIDTKALYIHKGNVNVSDNAQFNVISSGGYESYGIYLWDGNMNVTGSAKINAKSDNASGTSAIYTDTSNNETVLTVSDNASIIAQAGVDSNSPGVAINFTEIIVSDNAVIKGVSGNNNQLEEGEEISGSRYGIYSEKLTATGCAEIIGIAGKAERDSYGVFSRNATVSNECKITGVSGVSEEFSVGVGFSNADINGNSQINAESDKAVKRDSMGLGSYRLDVSGNVLINAKGGAVGTSNGISAGIYVGDSAKFYGSAKIYATTAPDDIYDDRNCHGICAEFLSINDNVKITASGNAKYTSVGISTNEIEINGAPSITATGNYSAFNLSEYYEILKNEDTDIFVSTDTDPDNSTEWDGESVLMTYFDGSNNVVSPYKYVKIEPAEKTYTVTYYLTVDGEVYDTKTFAEGETIVNPVPETEPGITFVEWADEDGNPLPKVMGTEDIIAYAVLNVDSYDVTYMIDGSVYEKYTVTYGAEVSVPDAPEKEGFIFVGWTPEIPDSMPANDLTFIAVFERKSYTLTYDVNGGSGNITEQTGDVAYTIGSTVPFRSGYNFLGWSTDKNSTTAEYVPGDTVNLTADTTLYAVWAKRSYLLTESDIFSFVNSRSNFKTGTYTMTDSDFIKLTDYISKLYNAKTAATYINRLQVARSDAWGGSCFGMSMSVILNKTGQIDFVENFDPSAANMYGVARPYQNEAVQSAINYYQISQRVNGFRTTTYTIDKGNFSTGLEKLVNTVKDGNMTLLIYSWPEGCHAIVIVGYEKTEGGHNLIAYDNRYGKNYINVYIDDEYNTCIVNGKEEAYYVEFNTNFSIFNKIDIDGPGNDMVFTSSSESIGTEIGIKLNGNITIKNAEGETLTVTNGIIGGDMEVISSYVIVNSTVDNPVVPGTLMLKVEDSDSFTFDSTADEISASLSTDECYAEVTATADTVMISEDEGIYTAGDDVEFNGWLSLNNDMGDVIGFDGHGDDVNLLYGNDGDIIVEGANDESTITVYKDTVDVDTVTFDSDYEALKISESSDNIVITASSKNDGIFDVKVADIINTEPTVIIANPSTTQINYGDKIILHANTEIDLPKGYYIVWTADNENFTYEVSDDDKTCTITPSSSGDTTITVTVYNEKGEIVDTDTQEMTSKAGLWQKIVAFFKKIFGLTKTIPQIYKDIF